MSEKSNMPNSWNWIAISPEKLRYFFLKHLDRIYSAKLHLIAKLPLLVNEARFSDLKNAIEDTIVEVEKQVVRMQMIYTVLDAQPSAGKIRGLEGLVDDAFEAISEEVDEPGLSDLSILFYLQNIESVEMSSFQILQMAAVKLENKQVNHLLKENYEDAKSSRALLLLISSKYMVS